MDSFRKGEPHHISSHDMLDERDKVYPVIDAESKPGFNFLNLLNINDDRKAELSESIKAWDGVIRLLVHQYYEHGDYEIHREETQEKMIRLDRAISRLVSMKANKRPPLVFMEEEEMINILKNLLMKDGESSVYFIKTYPGTSEPLIYPREEDPKETYEKNWSTFTDILDDLGVKRVILSGSNFWIREAGDRTRRFDYGLPGEDVDKPELKGCAGRAARMLREKMPVSVSNLTLHQGRKELREQELADLL